MSFNPKRHPVQDTKLLHILKTIPCSVAHTHQGQIKECTPWDGEFVSHRLRGWGIWILALISRDMYVLVLVQGVKNRWFLGVADTNDVIQKIEKTLNNTHTTTQKLTNNSFRNTKKHPKNHCGGLYGNLEIILKLVIFCNLFIVICLPTDH